MKIRVKSQKPHTEPKKLIFTADFKDKLFFFQLFYFIRGNKISGVSNMMNVQHLKNECVIVDLIPVPHAWRKSAPPLLHGCGKTYKLYKCSTRTQTNVCAHTTTSTKRENLRSQGGWSLYPWWLPYLTLCLPPLQPFDFLL